jgi:predicted nucleotidyltransferase
LNRKLNLFLKNIQNDHKDSEIDIVFEFEEDDFKEICSYLNHSKVDERVFQYLIRTVKSDSIKGRLLQLASEKGNFDAVRLLLDQKAPVDA